MDLTHRFRLLDDMNIFLSDVTYGDICTIFVLQARVDRMEDFKKKGEDINKTLQECRRKVAEAQKKVQELTLSTVDEAKAELSKAQSEEKKLKKEEREWEKKMDEHNREEKKMPWNVDTLSKDGFCKVRQINCPVRKLWVLDPYSGPFYVFSS